MLRRKWTAIFTLVGCLALAGVAAAQEARQRYDVYIGGIRLGVLGLDSNISGNRYAASGRVAGSGIVGAIVQFDFAGTAQGIVRRDGSLQPTAYSARSDDGKTARTVTMSFKGTTPENVSFSPARRARDYDVQPGSQSGTLDPISATFSLLRDQPVAQACGKSVEIFDGSKRSRITVSPREAARDGLFACNGTYTRVAGFSEKLMRRKRNFSFQILFRDVDGIMEVVRFQSETTFGRASAIRR